MNRGLLPSDDLDLRWHQNRNTSRETDFPKIGLADTIEIHMFGEATRA